jgi:hypothetical protein
LAANTNPNLRQARYGQPTPVAAVVEVVVVAVVVVGDEQAGLLVGVVDKAVGFD